MHLRNLCIKDIMGIGHSDNDVVYKRYGHVQTGHQLILSRHASINTRIQETTPPA